MANQSTKQRLQSIDNALDETKKSQEQRLKQIDKAVNISKEINEAKEVRESNSILKQRLTEKGIENPDKFMSLPITEQRKILQGKKKEKDIKEEDVEFEIGEGRKDTFDYLKDEFKAENIVKKISSGEFFNEAAKGIDKVLKPISDSAISTMGSMTTNIIGGNLRKVDESDPMPSFLRDRFGTKGGLISKKKETSNAEEFVGDLGRRIQGNWDEAEKELDIKREQYKGTQGFLYDLSSGFTSLSIAVGSTLATGNPNMASSIFGLSQAGEKQKELVEAGVEGGRASRLSTEAGLIETGLEYIGLDYITSRFSRPIFSLISKSAVEGMQEFSQEVGSNIISKIGYDKSRNILENAWYSGLIGMMTAAPTSVAIDTVHKSIENEIKNKYPELMPQAEQIKDAVDNFMENTRDERKGFLKDKSSDIKEQLKKDVKTKVAKKAIEESSPPINKTEQSQEDKLGITKNDKSKEATGNENISTIKSVMRGIKAKNTKQADFLKKKETTLLKNRIKNFARGIREGRLDLRKELSNVLDEGISLLEESNIPLKERAKFVRKLKNIATAKDPRTKLEKSIPEIKNRILRFQEKKAIQKKAKSIKDNTKKSVLKGLRPEYKSKIKELTKELQKSDPTQKTKDKLSSRFEFIVNNLESSEVNKIPDEQISELKRLYKKPLNSLTLDEITAIDNAIKHFIHLNKTKNKLIQGKRVRKAQKEINKAVKNVIDGSKINKDESSISTFDKEVNLSKAKQFFTISHYKMETLATILDKKLDGAIKDILYNGIDEGRNKELEFKFKAQDFIRKRLTDSGVDITSDDFKNLSKAFNKKEKNVEKLSFNLDNGKTIVITPGERIALILHSRNSGNLTDILNAGIRLKDNPLSRIELTSNDLKNIVNSATDNEIAVADAMSDFLNNIQRDTINKVSVRLNGFEIATEDNYWHKAVAERDIVRDPSKTKNRFAKATLEGMGIFKEKTKANTPVLLEDAFIAFNKNIKKVSAYIGLSEPLRNAKMLIYNNEFRDAVEKHYSKQHYEYILNYLDDIEMNSSDTSLVGDMTLDIMNKIDRAILGANLFVILKQPVSYTYASNEVDSKYLFNPKVIFKKPNFEEIKKNSPQLRMRLEGNVTREMGELGQVGATMRFFTDKTLISNKVMEGIRKADYAAIGRIWEAAKLEISDKFPNLKGKEYIKKVQKRAEEIIRLTQPTWDMKDRSAIARDKSVWTRLATKYTSATNAIYNNARRSILKYNISNKNLKEKAKLTKRLATIYIVAQSMITGINWLRDLIGGKDTGDMWDFVIDTICNWFAPVYIVRDIVTSLKSKVKRGTWAGWGYSNVLISFLDKAINGTAGIGIGIYEYITKERYERGSKAGEEKWKTSFINALDDLASTAGRLKGIPYSNIMYWLESGKNATEQNNKIKNIKGGKINDLELDMEELDLGSSELDNLELPEL